MKLFSIDEIKELKKKEKAFGVFYFFAISNLNS